MGILEVNFSQLIFAGGATVFPIILCSIFAFGVIIEKLVLFSKINTNTHNLKNRTFDYIKQNKIKEAVEFCEKEMSPVAKILKAGLIKFGSSPEDIKQSMEDMSQYEVPKLEKRLTALATIAHITPLLGLLGTVIGMTRSFYTIQVRASSLNPVTPGDLAGGIWEALLSTVAGLIVAIPTYVAYNYFVSRINYFILEMERGATELINFMTSVNHSEHVN